MNEREEQIRQRLETFKAELSAKSILPVHLSAKETQSAHGGCGVPTGSR